MAQPRYTLITGDFYIRYPDLPRNVPEPDGDTINFLPDNDDLVRSLPRFSNRGPDRRHLGTYGTRFEGIDTLETHFENQHQDLTFARAARDHMLDKMGFGAVKFWEDLPNKVESAEHHPVRGYLLANGVESTGSLRRAGRRIQGLDRALARRVSKRPALLTGRRSVASMCWSDPRRGVGTGRTNPSPPGPSMAGDVLLPGEGARIAPTTFDEWLAEQR